MTCTACGWSLRNTTGNYCPACGNPLFSQVASLKKHLLPANLLSS
jgi:predicted RNA-binding Zn-ribbon protein involved in translation (DUF1610 family)